MSETRLRPALKGKELVLAIVRWILIIFFAAYTLFPLIWLVISSLKTNFEFLAQSPFSLPAKPQWSNYINALTVAGLGRMLLNSVFVGLLATLLNVVIASMSAYCISRFRFRGREKIFTLFTAGILVPLNALMVSDGEIQTEAAMLIGWTPERIRKTVKSQSAALEDIYIMYGDSGGRFKIIRKARDTP